MLDLLAEYLQPPLQGFRLKNGKYRPIEPALNGALISESTGLTLRREGTRLRLADSRTGEPLLRPLEMNAALKGALAALEVVEARAQAPEAEIVCLPSSRSKGG